MHVKDAIATRRSVRAFHPDPVPVETIMEILTLAGRAPSGANLQPWRVYVLAEAGRDELVHRVKQRAKEFPKGEKPQHQIHPTEMREPYHSRYMRASGLLYGAAGIQREDMVGRQRQLMRNWEFFGAPIGLILTVHREMQPGQWSDVGMFMQNVMLLARSRNLDTCAQESWALWPSVLHDFLGIPDDEIVYCGMAVGIADLTHPINQFESERAGPSEYVTVKRTA